MATKKKSTHSKKKSGSKLKEKLMPCAMPPLPERIFAPHISADHARAIIVSGSKWVNGTVLHYYFFTSPAKWKGTEQQKTTVRDAFKVWKDVGIGMEFMEVNNPGEAEIRIGFERKDGHWSFLGRGVLDHGASKRTMNFDKSDNWGIDTAVHEIGHTLGLPHEHQNPIAGIVWDEQAVIDDLAGFPNFWPESVTRHNILRTINPDTVQGSNWDADSIMHYSFKAGLIKVPVKYQSQRLDPAPGLSTRDKKWIKLFYPPLTPTKDKLLKPFESQRLSLDASEQVNFRIEPEANRSYLIQTFGTSDTVMVLFEDTGGDPEFVAGDDDSGDDRNATLNVRLQVGRKYILRLRLYRAHSVGDFGVMLW